jgi:hypothetical protein
MLRINFTLLALLLLLPLTTHSQTSTWEWAYGDVNPIFAPSKSHEVAIDHSGNIIFVTYIDGSNLGFTFNGAGIDFAFGKLALTKTDPDGNVIWMKTNGWNTTYHVKEVKTDALNNIYVLGEFLGPLNMNGTIYSNATGADMFLARFDSTGEFMAVTWNNGNISNDVYDMAVSDSGDVYLTGSFWNTLTFPDTAFTSLGYDDSYIAKYNRDLTLQWAQHVRGANGTSANPSVAIEPSGTILTVIHNEYASVNIGATFFNQGVNIARLDASTGSVLFNRRLGERFKAIGMEVYADGSFFVTGEYYDTMYVGSANTPQYASPGGNDLCFLKYDAAGNPLWIRSTTCPPGGGPYILEMEMDASGNAFVAGYLTADHNFGTNSFNVASVHDGFVTMWDKNGNHKWAQKPSSTATGSNEITGLAVDNSGHVYVAGYYGNSAELDAGLIMNAPTNHLNALWAKISFPAIEFSFSTPTLCLGNSFNLAVNTNLDFNAGNQFLAELSDETGSFSAPTVIGSVTATTLTTLACTIPSGVLPGTGYRIRIRATDFAFTTPDNGSDISISENTLSFGPIPALLCAGTSFSLPYSIVCPLNSGNAFVAEISDASGNFSAAQSLGTVNATASGSLTATLPSGLSAGTAYRIRMRSTTPADTAADNGIDLTVFSAPAQPVITLFGADSLVSSPATLYQWRRNTINIGGATNIYHIAILSGNYSVETTDANGCKAISASENVTITSMLSPSLSFSNLSVWPNPSEGNFAVQFRQPSAGLITLQLTDPQGRVVQSQTDYAPSEAVLSFATEAAAGIYFLTVARDGFLPVTTKAIIRKN